MTGGENVKSADFIHQIVSPVAFPFVTSTSL